MLKIFPIATILLLFVIQARSEELNKKETIRTVAGYEIPIQDFRHKFPNGKQISREELQSRIYHISLDSHILRGHDRVVDLNAVTNREQAVPMNENLIGRVEPSITREGEKYGYSYTVKGRNVLSVWGPNLNLMPLHQTKHPEIYIHSSYPSSTISKEPANKKENSRTKTINSQLTVHKTEEQQDNGMKEEIVDLNSVNRQESIVPPGVSCGDKLPSRIVEIVAAYDHTFCEMYGGNETSANAAVTAAFSRANVPFALYTCLRLDLIDIKSNCIESTDPYGSLKNFEDPSNILSEFRNHWVNKEKDTKRDAAILLTGFDDGEPTFGQSYLAATCTTAFSYARVEGAQPIFIAHQFGLMVGATRASSTGIMKRSVDVDDDMVFSKLSVEEIVSFVDTDLAGRSSCFAIGRIPPRQTPLPSMSSTPSPLARKMTCVTKFKRNEGLDCSKEKYIGEEKTEAGWVDIRYRQRRDKVILRVDIQASTWKENNTKYYRRRIIEYRRKVSAVNNPSDVNGDLGGRRISPNGAKWWQTKWSMNGIESNGSSCCGQTLYFYVEVVAELWVYDAASETWSYGGNERIRRSYQSEMICLECLTTQTFFPPSSNRQCPQCIS